MRPDRSRRENLLFCGCPFTCKSAFNRPVKRTISISVIAVAAMFAVYAAPALPSAFVGDLGVYTAYETYYRTELYFGRSKPGGGMVTDAEWERFLNDVVTPRFPEGFTILKGMGQYREKSGKIISEPSQVLIFLYPKAARKTSRAKIDEIRAAYVKQFAQESVLRLDMPQRVRVSF